MNQREFNELRRKRIDRASKENTQEMRALGYMLMSDNSELNQIQARLSAYVVSGKGELCVSKLSLQ